MIAHIVLLTPRPDLSREQQERLVAAFERAALEIESVKSVRIGRRVRHEQAYEAGIPDLGFCAIFEFEDLAALQAYLQHPAHEELGARFHDSLSVGLAYDYQMASPDRAREWLGGGRDAL